MSEVADFKPGLEGVVAVETEIAEFDREGGVLRYRGVDIEELVGQYPYERVWGLLVDDDLDSVMPEPEPHEPAGSRGMRRPIFRPRRPGSQGSGVWASSTRSRTSRRAKISAGCRRR